MRKFIALLAVIGALFVAGGVAATAAPASPSSGTISYNVEPGGGTVTSFFYIARVYIYYDGYYHWLNCQYVVYTNGSIALVRCW